MLLPCLCSHSCLKLTQEFYSLIRPRPKLSNFATYFRNIARFCPKLAKSSAINVDFLGLNGFITNIQAILLVIALIVWRIGNNSQVNMQSGQTYHQFRGNFSFCCTGQLRGERRVILCYQCVESIPLPMSK